MDFQLTQSEARVLGVMLEKEMTTPDNYPLSLNALVTGCNQKTNREPVVNYDDSEAIEALDSLRHKGLSLLYTGSGRVAKYGHRLSDKINFRTSELAVICVLLLRGPQTVGEIKERTQRMYDFDDIEAVDGCLRRLAENSFVKEMAREPGQKEPRNAHLFCGEPTSVVREVHAAAPASSARDERIEKLEAEVAALRLEFAAFRKQFE